MSERRRVFLDSETDSLPPDHRPWEIALVYESGGFPTERVLVVLDVDLSEADPKSLAMNGFHDRHPLGDRFKQHAQGVMYVAEAEAAVAVMHITSGATMVAAQVQFDTECLAAMLRRHNLEPAWHYRQRELESTVAGFLRRDVGGLQDCAKALGIVVDPEQVHSALGDARLVRACWQAVFGGAENQPARHSAR